MTATYRSQYISVVKCDGIDCGNFDAQEDVLFDAIDDAEDHGKNHGWVTRGGNDHFCDLCWCDECDEPVESCAHVTTS